MAMSGDDGSATVFKRVKHEPSDGRPAIQYRIQLVDQASVPEATQFMLENFIPNENILTSIGLLAEEGATVVACSIWEKFLSEGVSLAAFLEDEQGEKGPMISCNVLNVERKDRSEEVLERSKRVGKMADVLQTLEDLEKDADVFTLYNCEAFVHGFGLSVASEYERRGIGGEMLRARAHVCKLARAPVSATAFTGAASQKLAQSCGYETLSQLDLTTYRIRGQIVYPRPKWPVIKWMAIRYHPNL